MLACQKCGAYGTVEEHTRVEWKAAFYSPSYPYRWHEPERVTLREAVMPSWCMIDWDLVADAAEYPTR